MEQFDLKVCKNWLKLCLLPGLGPVRLQHLLSRWSDPGAILAASAAQLRVAGLPDAVAMQILRWQQDESQHPLYAAVQRTLNWAVQDNHALIHWHCDLYPDALRVIDHPPYLLWAIGQTDLLALPQVAFVGSRQPSAQAVQTTQWLAESVARAGLMITSGLAKGIDAAAHQAALAQGSPTIAVLGNGVDRMYPRQNRALYQAIAQQGVLLSDYPLGTAPKAGHFPRRNRLISGLSKVVVVVEAAINSGSLITARYALEQGKDVMAVPGIIGVAYTQGTNHLLKQGAHLVMEPEDILHAMQWPTLPPCAQLAKPAEPMPKLCAQQQQVLACLDALPTPIDELVHRLQQSPQHLMPHLLALELMGVVQQQLGGYVRC